MLYNLIKSSKTIIYVKKHRYLIFLLFLSIFHILNNVYILSIDTTPILGDEAVYFKESINIYNDFKEGKILKLTRYHYFDEYPNLFFWLNSIIYLLFGISKLSAVMTNIFPLVILIFSMYGIGTELHSREAGLLAAFIVTTFPHIFAQSRFYSLELNLVGFLALAIFTLLKTNKFGSKKYSLVFGFCLGLLTLTKAIFVAFFTGPFLIYIFTSFSPKQKTLNKQKIINIVFSLLIASLIALSWWNISTLTANLKNDIRYLPTSDLSDVHYLKPIKFGWERISYHLDMLFGFEILYYYFILFIFALLYIIFLRRKNKFFLLSSFFVPYIFLTIFLWNHPNLRYIFPTLIFVALIIATFLCSIKNKKVKKIIIVLTLLIGLSQYFILSYTPNSHKIFYKINNILGTNHQSKFMFLEGFRKYSSIRESGLLSISQYEWNFDKMLEIINNSIESKKKKYKIRVSDNSLLPLIYYATSKRFRDMDILIEGISWPNIQLNNTDFIIIPSNLSLLQSFKQELVNKTMTRGNYSLVGTVPWPLNITIGIYKREDN